MTFEDDVQRIFDKYYLNNLMPTSIGGDSSTSVFKFLMAYDTIQQLAKAEANISEDWIGKPSWFTNSLRSIFKVPRFSGESDKDYYNRLIELTDISQDKNGLYIAIHSLLGDAIDDPSVQVDIKFTSSVAGLWGDDLESGTWDIYWNNDPQDLWGDTSETLRADVRIDITFNNSGSASDPDNYEYWVKEENITKIEEMVELAKPPGITYELNLISPLASSYSITSPSDGATGVSASPTLDWDDVSGATKYQVQLVKEKDLTQREDGIPQTDLVAYYPLDGDVLDYSGNGYDGTNNGVTFDVGQVNSAGDFDGSSSRIEVPNLQTYTEICYSLWINIDVLPSIAGNNYHVIDLENTDGNSRLVIWISSSDDTINARLTNDVGTPSTKDLSSTAISIDTWYHIIIRWDGTNFYLDVNDINVDSTTFSGTVDLSSLGTTKYIGSFSSTNYFDGLIDESRLFDRSLSTAEITNLASQRHIANEVADSTLNFYDLDASTEYFWRFRPYVNSTWHNWSDWFSFTTT